MKHHELVRQTPYPPMTLLLRTCLVILLGGASLLRGTSHAFVPTRSAGAWVRPSHGSPRPLPTPTTLHVGALRPPSSTHPPSHTSSSSSPRRFSKPPRQTIRELFQRARTLERRGQWRQSANLLRTILQRDPHDAHSHLALARLEARRAPHTPDRAVRIFENGTRVCPDSIHLWHAYAHFMQSQNRFGEACRLYERALQIDPYNPYVCHAYGLMLLEKGAAKDDEPGATAAPLRTTTTPTELWQRALSKTSTAALVCSLGELWIAQGQYDATRQLYDTHVAKVRDERERMEIYLAASWLEERYLRNYAQAEQLMLRAVDTSPTSSVAKVALARFEGRKRQDGPETTKHATLKKLASVCIGKEKGHVQPVDGRVYNAWASMEVKQRRFSAARTILRKGLEQYPHDHSLLQAAGKVEERLRNFTGARELYAASLRIEPSAPTIVAYALLEIRHPESKSRNLTKALGLFEEALLIDPRHGPTYNAYARTVFQKLGDAAKARDIFERGIAANCPDAASIYHGSAMLELWLGEVERARERLLKGIEEVKRQDAGKDYVHRERAIFLSHTLGMLELNRNLPTEALQVFNDGISRYGNSSQLLLGAALSEVMLGRQQEARSLFEMSVASDARHAQAWQAWGVMEMRAGNIDAAKSLFESGLKNVPRHGALWQAYATMESRFGNIESARALFETGVKKAPHHVPLYQSWAFMELREGNYLQAKTLICKALTRNKRNGSGWLIYSKIEDQLGNAGLAILLLRRGIECAPDMPELYCALGDLLMRRGKINDAREVYEKGIEIDPMHAQLYHSLAELEAQVFNLEGLAKLNWRAKQVFNPDALAPTKASAESFGTKLRTRRAGSVPNVTALAERVVEEDVDEQSVVRARPSRPLNKIGSTLLEDGRVGKLLSVEDQE